MIAAVVAIAVVAAALLFASGWLSAARRGRQVRADLTRMLDVTTARAAGLEGAIGETRGQAASLETRLGERTAHVTALEGELGRVHGKLAAVEGELGRARADLAAVEKRAPHAAGESVATLRAMLAPVLEREKLAHDLSSLQAKVGLRDLPKLLDAISDAGGFSAVVLSDDAGLPVAASANAGASAQMLDRLVGAASLVLMLADRAESSSEPRPLGVVMHDESNRMVVFRIFTVDGARFVITAAARGRPLLPNALDPIVGKLETVLARRTFAA